MSGMEPLAVFGFVCNVMQVIHFTSETVSLCKKAFRTGSPDSELGRLVNDSAKVYEDLVKSIQSTAPLTEDQTKLFHIAKKTRDAALEVRAEANRIISSSTKGDTVAAIVEGIKAKLREGKLDKVQKRLRDYQTLLESGFLSLICKKTDALSLQQETRFNDLDETLRQFIRSYAQGETQLATLITKQSESIKHAIRTENAKVQNNIITTVVDESLRIRQGLDGILQEISEAPPRWKLRKTFLKSLRYESMNDRLEQVSQPHEGTYQWIMRGVRPWLDDGEVIINENRNQPNHESDCPHETASLGLPWRCFPCWIDSDNSSDKVYWVQGKPGSGKSTLMKFLVSEQTLWSDLKVFKSDPLIISHFFWASGQQVQRSLRGMLLAMLSQFLSVDQVILDEIVDHFPQATLKYSHKDWSTRELQAIIEKWFAKSGRPVYVFLDGLDEADPDDEAGADDMPHQSLLTFITKRLASIRTVKVCVSSRPEPIFKNHLVHTPTLHLQHLTRLDMKRYIHACLLQAQPTLEGTSELRTLVDRLLEMSGGVFLWVALTVKSLCRGLMNGDTPQEIHLRLRQIPRGLHSLYQNMWSRLNEDEKVYRQEAALYINMVLDWPDEGLPGPVLLFYCLMASQPSTDKSQLSGSTQFSAKELDILLRATAKRIETRTAGLLEVSWGKSKHDDPYVGIIHRSAVEFFRNTTEGQEILHYDAVPLHQRRARLYRSIIAELWVQASGGFSAARSDAQWREDFQHKLCKIYEAWDEGRITRDDALEFLSSCKRLYETEKSLGVSPVQLPVLDFTGLAAFLGLPNFVFASVHQFQSVFPDKCISAPYRIYLLVAALAPFRYDPFFKLVGFKAKIVEFLVNNDILSDPSHGIKETNDTEVASNPSRQEEELYVIILLSILNNQVVWPASILPLPKAIQYFALKCASSLQKKALVVFQYDRLGKPQNDADFRLYISVCSSRILNSSSFEMKMWVALELDILSLIELLLQAMVADPDDPSNAEISRQVLEELRRSNLNSFERNFTIKAFHVPPSLGHRWGRADLRGLELRQTTAREDHELLNSSLAQIRRDSRASARDQTMSRYRIPTLTDCLRDLGQRNEKVTTLGAFMDMVAENPLNKMAEEFMLNPPNLYVE